VRLERAVRRLVPGELLPSTILKGSESLKVKEWSEALGAKRPA